MQNRTPVFSAVLSQVLGAGLQPDLHLLQKVLWAVAENVTFFNGRIKTRKGLSLLYDAGADQIRGITQMQDSDGVRWVWAACGDDVSRWYGPAFDPVYTAAAWVEDETSISPATWWDLVPYGNWMLMNTGVGNIKVYKPEVDLTTTLGDSPVDVVTLMKKQAFILAIGYGAAKTRVGWSDDTDIAVWTADVDNLAGSLTIAEFNTPIRAASTLGDSISIYGEDQMAFLNFIGSPFYFGYKFKLDGIGAIGKKAVATDGQYNVGVSRNGIWWTDGNSYKYLDEGALHDYLQDNVNWEQGSKIVAVRNDVTQCFEFAFPMGLSTDPTEAWSYDPRVGAWCEVPVFSAKDERKLFSKPVLGSLDGILYLDQDDGTSGTLSLKTRPVLCQLQDETGFKDTHNNVNVQEVDIFLKTATNVEWRLGASQEPTAEPTWTPWITAVAGAVSYKVPRGLPSGVYHTLEFRSIDAAWDFDLQGFEFFGRVEGTKRP